MAITRAPRPTGNFYILDKKISEDKRLTWAARGLLIFLLGKPDNWTVSVSALVHETESTIKNTRRDGIWALLKELMDAGYCTRSQVRLSTGRMGEMDYAVSESPMPLASDWPGTAKPGTAKPGTADTTLTSTDLKQELNSLTSTHTAKPKSSKACAVKEAKTKTVCVPFSELPKAQETEQPSPVKTPKPETPLEVTLENLANVLKASGIEASASVQADAISITLTKGKALDYAVGTVKRKLASREAAPATFAPANNLTTPSVQPVYKHEEVTVASKAVRDAALAALTGKLAPIAPIAPVATPKAENTAFTPLTGQPWAIAVIERKRAGEKVSFNSLKMACDELRVNKKTLNQE